MSNHAGHQKRKSSLTQRGLRKNNGQRVTWITRGVELAVVLSSIFWAVEASAWKAHTNRDLASTAIAEKKPYAFSWDLKDIQSRPVATEEHVKATPNKEENAELTRELASASQVMRSSHALDSSTMKQSYLAPSPLYFGDAMSQTFKRSPYYVTTSMTVIRFPTFK